jgi:SAM-dependent methyltransferase
MNGSDYEEICHHLSKEKHSLYQKSVQNPKREVEFYRKVYRLIFKSLPVYFREDFCGTALLSCEWVKNNVCNQALGIDIDKDTLEWGHENNINNLSSGSDRIKLINQNVLQPFDPKQKFDIICSMNYSHFLLNKRSELVKYFSNVRRNINRGLFIIDFYGGLHTYSEHRHNNQSDFYEFHNEQMNILDNVSNSHLRYKTKEGKLETLFTYNFRVYSIIELREALEDSGFDNFKIYIKDVSDDEENTFSEYQEVDINGIYKPELDRYNGYLIAIINS